MWLDVAPGFAVGAFLMTVYVLIAELFRNRRRERQRERLTAALTRLEALPDSEQEPSVLLPMTGKDTWNSRYGTRPCDASAFASPRGIGHRAVPMSRARRAGMVFPGAAHRAFPTFELHKNNRVPASG